MTKNLILIDGYSIIYQSYFAFLNRPLLNPQGKNSSAVFGFFRTLFQVIRDYQPTHLAVVMDSKTPTFRHVQYPAYKAHRDAAPEDLHPQTLVIEEILSALGIGWCRLEGFEADDLIATLAERAQRAGMACRIVSRDKDILQLVGGSVSVLRSGKNTSGFELWDGAQVKTELGITPEQMIDYLALIGDQSDNVPGVAGIGPKTAVKLLSQFGTLEEIYRHLDKLAAAQKSNLTEGQADAFLSKQLVTLVRDAPLAPGIESFFLKPLESARAIPLFQREGMKSLIQELGGAPAAEPTLGTAAHNTYISITDETALADLVQRARAKGVFALDTETDSLDIMQAEPVGISLALEPNQGYYIPVCSVGVACIEKSKILKHLTPLLTDPQLLLVGQNIKFDYKVLYRQGLGIKNRLFDTMVAAWILDSEGTSSYNLDALAEKYLSYRTIKYTDVVTDTENSDLSDVPLAVSTEYSGEDADVALRLYQSLSPKIKAEGFEKLFDELEMPLIPILAEMELAGIRVLPNELVSLGQELSSRLAKVEKEIFALTGKEFNLNSPKQLAEILFTDLKLKPVKKIKTGFSTDNQVLEVLAQEHDVPCLILDHRSLSKLKNTYVDILPSLINPATGRIHTQYLQTGTATGRIASKDPNLQNIPIRDETGRAIRQAFVPEAGWQFISADYSQIELVVLAHLSGDPLLIEAFRTGSDVHSLTASLVFKKAVETVTPEERRMGKTINFGVMYGMSAFRLAQDFKIGRKEAAEFIESYFQRYTNVQGFRTRVLDKAAQDLFVTTLLGRRRSVPGIGSSNRMERSAAERIAFNTTIQGSAADIVKTAMRAIAAYLSQAGLRSRLLLQVHDELILEAPDNEVAAVKEKVRKLMETAVSLQVPLKVNIETGTSWGTIH